MATTIPNYNYNPKHHWYWDWFSIVHSLKYCYLNCCFGHQFIAKVIYSHLYMFDKVGKVWGCWSFRRLVSSGIWLYVHHKRQGECRLCTWGVIIRFLGVTRIKVLSLEGLACCKGTDNFRTVLTSSHQRLRFWTRTKSWYS